MSASNRLETLSKGGREGKVKEIGWEAEKEKEVEEEEKKKKRNLTKVFAPVMLFLALLISHLKKYLCLNLQVQSRRKLSITIVFLNTKDKEIRFVYLSIPTLKMIMIIIITFKGALGDFFPHCAAICL